MANFLKLRGAQLASGAIGDGHIDPLSPITEAKLSLAYGTSGLNTAITNLSGKKFLSMIGINGVISSGIGSSLDVSTAILAASASGTPGGSDSVAGIVTTTPNNKVQIRATANGQPVEHSTGADVFGRLTEAAGVYTLSFVYEDTSGVEHAYTFAANTGIDILYPESFSLSNIPFNSLMNGVAFVDGLPAAHEHSLAAITDVTVSVADVNDLVTAADLALTTGAASVGYDNTTSELTADTVQEAIDEIKTLVGAGVPTFVVGENLTSQVDDGTPAAFTVTNNKFDANSLAVFVNGSRQVRGIQFAETTPASGVFTFDSGCVPITGDVVTVDYSYL